MQWRVFGFGMVLGCGGAAPTSMSSTSSSSSEGSTSSTSTSADDADDGSEFVTRPDAGGDPACDLFGSDCPPGQKCSAYALPGQTVPLETRCTDIAEPAGDLGEPCTFEGDPLQGLDDCGAGLVCIEEPAAPGTGTCWLLCQGPQPDLTCPPEQACRKGSGALRICTPACDPLADDCDPGEGCYPLEDWMVCLPDASGMAGSVGSPCMFTNGCDPGSTCKPLSSADCPTDRCCTPFCRMTSPECPEPTQQCIPIFAEWDAPSDLQDLGYCAISR